MSTDYFNSNIISYLTIFSSLLIAAKPFFSICQLYQPTDAPLTFVTSALVTAKLPSNSTTPNSLPVRFVLGKLRYVSIYFE